MDAVGLPVGTRVKLRPRAGGDVFDLALAGKTAVVDVGRDRHGGPRARRRAGRRRPGARPRRARASVLLLARGGRAAAGARRRDRQRVPRRRRVRRRAGDGASRFDGVDVVDFGIRGMDLAYALADYDVVVFLDATPRGEPPGTLYVIEPDLDELPLDVDAHAMDPVKVLALAKTLGGRAAADARARLRAGRGARSSPGSASPCAAALRRGRAAARATVGLPKGDDMRNAIIVDRRAGRRGRRGRGRDGARRSGAT